MGAAAAAAALYGHYRVLPAWLTGPEVCLMEDGGCAVLFRSPRSRLLGVPNALLGALAVLRSNALGTGATALQALAGALLGFGIASALMVTVGGADTWLWIALPVVVDSAS